MELGLSLGDSSSKPEHHHNHHPRTATTKKDGLNFCMALGILSDDIEDPENARKSKQHHSDDHISNDDGDDQTASEEEDGHCRDLVPARASLQLDLLPLAPVPRHHPFPWSSDNGNYHYFLFFCR